jgi:hypothetical protein
MARNTLVNDLSCLLLAPLHATRRRQPGRVRDRRRDLDNGRTPDAGFLTDATP